MARWPATPAFQLSRFTCVSVSEPNSAFSMPPTFFRTPAAFRRWLKNNHAKETELWIGYHKKASGKGGMGYKEALDEALCFGWIDGVVRSIDAESYMQRFTPRKK